MAATIKDVARLAEVTPIVVSKVLHDRGNGVRVSKEKAEQIRAIAKEINYRVNMRGRILRSRRTMMIGVMNGNGQARPNFNGGPRYFASIMDGIVKGAFSRGFSVALCPILLGSDPAAALNDGRFDGLIWYSLSPTRQAKEALADSEVPIVIVHAKGEDFDGRFSTVACDNEQGIGLAVDHLVGLGHRRIAFGRESDRGHVETQLRLDGFKAALSRHGLEWSDDDVVDFLADREGLRNYLTNPRPHSALVCHADGLAGDTLTIAKEIGLDVPGELSVIGFDSTEYCELFRPTMTSVYQPLFEEGESAVTTLIAKIEGECKEVTETIIPCGLDVRESTGPAKVKS